MARWKVTVDDIVSVLRRKGYQLISRPTDVTDKKGKVKRVDVLYAHHPGVVYGFTAYRPENTAEAVFSQLLDERGDITKQDYLDSI